jgi:putative flippase GtrA
MARPARLQLLRFVAIGIASTVVYAAVYALLRNIAPVPLANFLALLFTATTNTAANRHFTFGVRRTAGFWRDQLVGLAAFGVAMTLTTLSIAVMSVTLPRAAVPTEVAVLTGANLAATVMRFYVLRLWFERHARVLVRASVQRS